DLSTSDAGSGAALHRMLSTWAETATWSGFGGDGIQPGKEALSAPDARTGGFAGTVRVDVTASVAAWSLDPCSNHGWALLPRGNDGWRFSSSEGSAPPSL